MKRRTATPRVITGDNVVTFAPPRSAISRTEIKSIAALDFAPVAEFADPAALPDRTAAYDLKLQTLSLMTRNAIAILAKPKAKLIDLVAALDGHDHHYADDLLDNLMAAELIAASLRDLIRAAEHRLGIALANNIDRPL